MGVAHTVTRTHSHEAEVPAMKARLSDIAQHADVSEATVSRVLNGKPGVAERDAAGGPHLARRARLRPSEPAAPQERRAGRSGDARADQPDLPGVRPGDRDGAGPQRLHPGAVHPDARRSPRGRLRPDAAGPQRRRDHLRQRAARQHHDRPQPLRHPARPGAADRPGQRLHRGRRRPVHLQRRRRLDGPVDRPPGPARAHQHRAGRRAWTATCRSSARSPGSATR